MIKYIAEKQNKIRQKFNSYNLHGVPVKINDEINFDISKVLEKVESILPEKIFKNLSVIKIANMESVGKNLPFNAYYINKRLFINNEQDSVTDAVDDIVHEMSHHLEGKYSDLIYEGGRLAREFLQKRKMLHDLLAANGLRPPPTLTTELKYDKKIDNYLYSKLGAKLNNFLGTLFINEYSITSLREYYGVGFEKYLLDFDSHAKMKRYNPILFEKITTLIKVLKDEENEK